MPELGQEFGEALEDKMGASWVLLGEVVGLLPLVNVVFIGDIVVIMVVVSLADLHIEESDSSGKSS